MVMTVYEYPTFATSKMNLVFYLLVGGFLWFVPVALCSAEMATVKGWEKGDFIPGSQIHWEESGALQPFSFNGFKLQLALSR